MKIAIYGVSRAGKDYLIDKICKKLPLLHIKGSESLSKIANITTEEFKRMSNDEKNEIRIKFIEHLESEYKESDIIVDGHYAFPNNNNYEIAFTERDLHFYDTFLYLDTPSEIILERMRNSEGSRKNLKITIEDIDHWKEFEITNLKEQCLSINKELIILNNDIDMIIDWISLTLNSKYILSSEDISNHIINSNIEQISNAEKILLLDCDKTLSINDSTLDFFELAGYDSNILKETFNKDRYSLYQFYKIEREYSKLDINLYEELCKKTAKDNVVLCNDLIDHLKNKEEYLSIGITAGIKDIWMNIKKEIQFPDIIEGGSYLDKDNFIMSEEVKYLVAKKLRFMNKKVVAIGDSMVDIRMLKEADEGYIIAHNKLNKSVEFNLYNTKHYIKQSKFSKIHYKNISFSEEF